jgi:type VI secretion system secreted protein Hcp
MHKKFISLVAGLMVLAMASSASAAMTSYMTLTGQKSGAVKGSVTQKGHEGSIAVIAMNHEVVSPRDPASGLPTGKRMHKPLNITMELDQSTPILYNMLATNENIPTLEVKLWRPNPAGIETQYFTIRLTNANISDIRLVEPNVKNADTTRLDSYLEVSFTYQKIQWTWSDPSITGADDWAART